MSARAFREHGIVFQSTDQVKRYDGLRLLNEEGDLYFYCIILMKKIIPFKSGKLKKKTSNGKKDKAKSVLEAHYKL